MSEPVAERHYLGERRQQCPTASQTIGPFWHGLADPELADLTRFGAPGTRATLAGIVRDGDGAPVTDACVELWLPGVGWARAATGPDGGYAFTIVEAPAIAVAVFARGLLAALHTRVYLDDTGDALLSSIAPERRHTLLAVRDGDAWRWDITLQGPNETVFLAL
jgi:protocatechuate 3,4-dioxygenase alpha subunit